MGDFRQGLQGAGLGNLRSATDDDLNPDTGVAKHGDQGVNTEAIDLSPDKIADPGLGHSKQTCGLSLGQAPALNQLAEADHQIGPHLQILRLFPGEPEVAEYVTR
jgi:hypothetical protein